MTDEQTETGVTPQPGGGPDHAREHASTYEDESVRDTLARLYDSGRDYAEAEIDRQKLRAAIAGRAVLYAALLGIAAALLILAAFFALLVGLIVALAPVLTAIGATVAVAAAAILLAAVLLLLARARIRSIKRATAA